MSSRNRLNLGLSPHQFIALLISMKPDPVVDELAKRGRLQHLLSQLFHERFDQIAVLGFHKSPVLVRMRTWRRETLAPEN
jgi:hypothetical protein